MTHHTNATTMKRIAFFILSIAILSACNNKETDLNKDIAVQVSVKEITSQNIEQFVSTTGTVNPVKTVALKSEIAGKYHLQINPKTGRKFALGDYVKEGADIIISKTKSTKTTSKLNLRN